MSSLPERNDTTPTLCDNDLFGLLRHRQTAAATMELDTKLAPYHRTDKGNAERLVARYGNDIRYCIVRKEWLLWDGTRWRVDETGKVVELGKQVVARIYGEAATLEGDGRQELVKWAMRSESKEKLHAMLDMAKTDPVIALHPDELDTDPSLLNCLNGTLNLKAGELREHRREDLITRVLPVAYDPRAAAPTWSSWSSRSWT